MKNELTFSLDQIENRIYHIREVQVMLDFHLAKLYEVETKRINEQVKRNIKRFPSSFMFQLSESEWDNLQPLIVTTVLHNDLRSQFATAKRRTLPYVFTEQGVAMLSAVIKSETAINASIHIMNAFVKMRHILLDNSLIHYRLSKLEVKHMETVCKIEQVFKALEGNTIPTQGIFFDGQVFDAYELASKIIRSAQTNIVLIDNYIDETTLTHLSKKEKGVKVHLFTKTISKQLSLDVQKANEQYGNFEIKPFTKSHDRFLIIDNNEIYHLGASLKDLGKRWFAFSKMNNRSVESVLKEMKEMKEVI